MVMNTTLKATDKLTKARAGLVLDQPFYGALALKLKLVVDSECGTAWTDGVSLGYSPEFIDGLTLSECKGLVAHEVMHCALGHHVRRGQRDAKLWNEACDDVINPHLVAQGFALPECGRPGVSEDISAEALYSRRQRDQKQGQKPQPQNGAGQGQQQGQQPGQGQPQAGTPGAGQPQAGQGGAPADKGNFGEVRDAPAGTPNESEWKVAVQQAANVAKAAGRLPGHIKKLIDDVLAPKVNWKEALHRFVDCHARSDYRWNRPNRRHVHRGLYLPSIAGEQLPEIVVAIDTSGSVDETMLASFAGELTAILEQYPTTAHVIYCDSRVQGYREITSDDLPIKLERLGGGGTAFDPVWAEVEARGIVPCCCVYLTDLESNRFGAAPSYPVLWAKYDNGGQEPPFGEVVAVDE